MKFLIILLLSVSCASYKNPRAIKEAKLDGLKYESLKRFDAFRLDANLKLKSEIALCHQHNFEQAFDKFKNKLDKNLNNFTYWNQIGTCYILKKEYTKAKSFLDIAMANAKNNKQKSVVFNNLGVIYLENKNSPEAKQAFKQAIEQYPKWLTPRFNLAQIYLSFGIYQRAQRELNFLLKKNGQDVDFLNSMAHLKLMQRDFKSALVLFNKIPVDYRSRDDVATNLAMTYFMLGRFEEAKTALNNADKKNSFYVTAQLEITKKLEKVDGK